MALTAFNDALVRIETKSRLKVIESRQICGKPQDYADSIEPSSTGGNKMASVIVREAAAPAARNAGTVIIGR